MRQVASHAIPQADVLWDVLRVPEAVASGATTPAAVAAYLGERSVRQGYYYLRAAHTLGLIEFGSWFDYVVLTPHGQALVQADAARQRKIVRRILLQTDPMRAVLLALPAVGGMRLEEIAQVLQSLSTLSAGTARRRAQTVAAWLCAVDLAVWSGGQLHRRLSGRASARRQPNAAAA